MKVSLKTLGQIVTGNTPSKSNPEYWHSDDISFVKPDILPDNKVADVWKTKECISEAARSKSRIVGENAIFVTCIGSIGKIGIATKGEFAFNQQINAIIPNSKVFPKYLAYVLLNAKPRLTVMANAPVVPIINKSQFGDFQIDISENYEEQKRISAILDSIESIITQQNQALYLLDKLVKSRFVEMFGGIHDSVLYPYMTVDSFTKVTSGGTPDRNTPSYWENGKIRWVKTTELQNCVICDTEEKITDEGVENSSAKMVPANTILIAMYGQGKTRGMTGYLAIEGATNQACACILPSEEINQRYLWQYMILSYDKLRSMAKGGNQPNLNAGIIKSFPVLVPPLELQNRFASFVSEVDKSKLAVKQSLEKLETLKKSLMQQYFG